MQRSSRDSIHQGINLPPQDEEAEAAASPARRDADAAAQPAAEPEEDEDAALERLARPPDDGGGLFCGVCARLVFWDVGYIECVLVESAR